MIRILLLLAVLFLLALGFIWLVENPGSATLEWPVLGGRVTLTMTQFLLAFLGVVLVTILAVWALYTLLTSPKVFGKWRAGRRRERGYEALSRGLVAAEGGNALIAKRMTKEAHRLLPREPLTKMLEARTAMMEDRHDTARERFEALAADDETRLVGLRGLYLEAERLGEREAAAYYAEKAVETEPGTGWAVLALLRDQALHGEWREALATLENNRGNGLFGRDAFDRKKAVVLTALALDEEDAHPERARDHSLAAHKLAPDLVPAAATYARTSARLNDLKRAARVLEATWRKVPHPEIGETYLHLRPGDSVGDRIARARKIAGDRPATDEGKMLLARAYMDAGQFKEAREVMKPLLRERPTERACLLMADIEEAEHGDKGRVRDWLARALRAPHDPRWVADGIVSDEWRPVSPATGELDAFEWKVPPETNTRALEADDLAQLAADPREDDVEEAEVIEAKPLAAPPPVKERQAGKPIPVARADTSAAKEAPDVTQKTNGAAKAGSTDPSEPEVIVLERRPDDPGVDDTVDVKAKSA